MKRIYEMCFHIGRFSDTAFASRIVFGLTKDPEVRLYNLGIMASGIPFRASLTWRKKLRDVLDTSELGLLFGVRDRLGAVAELRSRGLKNDDSRETSFPDVIPGVCAQ